jgi:hypothetical protein
MCMHTLNLLKTNDPLFPAHFGFPQVSFRLRPVSFGHDHHVLQTRNWACIAWPREFMVPLSNIVLHHLKKSSRKTMFPMIMRSLIKDEPCSTVKTHLSTPTKVEGCRTGQRCRTGVLRAQEAPTDPGWTWNVHRDPARCQACRLCSSARARGHPVTLVLDSRAAVDGQLSVW